MMIGKTIFAVSLLTGMTVATFAEETPLAVFGAYEAAVNVGDLAAIKALIADDVERPTFTPCPPEAGDRQCLIDFIDRAVASQHSTLTTLNAEVKGDELSARIELRNDLTKEAGVERVTGIERIKVSNGKIIELVFTSDEQDAQTIKFFAYVRQSRGR